nr:helix-turn-helix domain-containing protein [Alistipes onderdonkii]
MNDNNVITADDERIASALYALKKCAKDADRLMDSFHPPLGGERYLTDKEVIARLKVSRRTLQEYRTARKIPFILFGGKVLYRETDIERLLTENYRKAIP